MATNVNYSEELTYLMDVRYYWKVQTLADDLGVSRQSLHAWKRGTTIPKKAHRERIHDLYMEVGQDEEDV